MKKEITTTSLKRFNLIMGFLHFIQGILMLTFSLTIEKISNFQIPILSNFLKFDPVIKRLITDTKVAFDLPFGIAVSLFLFLSALFHFIISVSKTNEIYNNDLSKGMNRFRWYEYALSSSLMIVLIATLFGVYDIGALIAIFASNAAMNLFGLDMELVNQKSEKTNWLPFLFGTFAGLAPWVIIIMHAFGNANLDQVPWFAYAIVGSYFVFFNLFPINMVLQYKKVGPWKNYLFGEKGYIVLSLAAKTVLAWLVFFGVMQPK